MRGRLSCQLRQLADSNLVPALSNQPSVHWFLVEQSLATLRCLKRYRNAPHSSVFSLRLPQCDGPFPSCELQSIASASTYQDMCLNSTIAFLSALAIVSNE